VDARGDDLHPGRSLEDLLETFPHDVAVLCQHYSNRPAHYRSRLTRGTRPVKGMPASVNRGVSNLEASSDRWESRHSRQGAYGLRCGRARKEQQVRGAGRVVFTGILLMIVGTINII